MIYSMKYTDTKGVTREARLSSDDSKEAIRNDFEELKGLFDPKYVKIDTIKAAAGEDLHIRITVMARSDYLSSKDDTSPKPCDSMSVDIICYPGYPLKAVKAFYPADHYLASPNVFRSGSACIDNWIPFKSSLISVAEKLVKDIIHDPTVTRYDSPANDRMIQWHKKNVANGRFPIMPPGHLYKPTLRALPPRKAQTRASKKAVPAPALPNRKH